MRPIDQHLVERLVHGFSHGIGRGFDPATQTGSQRESLTSLGFGWLYLALAQITEARHVLVIGSGRGFSVACFALGIEQWPDARVLFVDPGLSEWAVNGISDTADGTWKDPGDTAAYFASGLGVRNVSHLKLCSDEAFERLRAEGARFDVVLVDGEHSLEQSLRDLRNAWDLLSPGGIILAHDARCRHWPGVAAAVALFEAGERDAEVITLAALPGLALLQRRTPLLTIRRSTAAENDAINHWRCAEDVTPRPLHYDANDPRPDEDHADPRVGLFSIHEEDELVGGFGMKYCAFTAAGPDNFAPAAGGALEGYLRYGAVIRPDRRGRGRWMLATLETLRQVGDAGYYFITSNQVSDAGKPFHYRRVGRTEHHTAYHAALRRSSTPAAAATALSALQVENDLLRNKAERLRRDLDTLLSSHIWRMTAPLRRLLDACRRR